MQFRRFAAGLTLLVLIGGLVLIAASAGAKTAAPAAYEPCPDVPRYYSSEDERELMRAQRLIESEHFDTFERNQHFARNFQPAVPIRDLAEEFAVYGYEYVGQYRGYMLFEQYAYGYFAVGRLARFLANTGLEQAYPTPQRLVLQPPFIGGVAIPPDVVAFPCR